MDRRIAGRASFRLLVASAAITLMVLLLDLSDKASIGSAVALTIFAFVTIAHLRIFRETGALAWVLVVGLAVIAITLVTFTFTTLVNEPVTIVALFAILGVSIGLDVLWSQLRAHPPARRAGGA
jgi:uncharacterized membrane protein YfcA